LRIDAGDARLNPAVASCNDAAYAVIPMSDASGLSGRLSGDLFTECAEWIWEQIQEDGHFVQGELIELVLQTERTLDVQAKPHAQIAAAVMADFESRGIGGDPSPITPDVIEMVLMWEDDFLGFAGISRAES
jgi:hypothetical protein